MAQQNEIAQSRVVTKDGIVTATVVDNVSPDRIALMLIKASAGARFGNIVDESAPVSRAVKNLLIFPFTEL